MGIFATLRRVIQSPGTGRGRGCRWPLALVTGGSSGIGLALALRLVRDGGDVVLLARNPERLATAKAQLEAERIEPGQRVAAVSCDVANWEQTREALERVITEQGLPDLVVCSAGQVVPGTFEQLELDVFRRQMDVNYFGTLHVLKVLTPRMVRRGSGALVNVCSVAGGLGLFGYTAYSPSKFAVAGLTESLQSELADTGLTVTLVMPPDTDTPLLTAENRIRPPVTAALAAGLPPLKADVVARYVLRGAARGQALVLPGRLSALTYCTLQALGPLKGRLLKEVTRHYVRREREERGAPRNSST